MYKRRTTLASARWLPLVLLIACEVPTSAFNEHISVGRAIAIEVAESRTVLLTNAFGADQCATASTPLPIVSGAPVYLRACTGTAAQQFRWKNAGELIAWSGACLTADEGTGDRVVTEVCRGASSQSWVTGPSGDVRSHKNKCLGVSDHAAITGARLMVSSCRGSALQRWAMVNTTPAAPPPPAPTPVSTPTRPTLTRLVMSPQSVTMPAGGVQPFSISALWSDGTTDTPLLLWSATGGTVTNAGVFTAGNTGGEFQVTATQQGGSVSTVASITVITPRVIAFSISPKTSLLEPAQTLQYSTSAIWSDGVVRTHGTMYTVTGGSITNGGFFSAPSAAATVLIIATCSCGLADTAEAQVRAVPLPPVLNQLSINPRSPTMAAGATQQFSVSAQWSNGSVVVPPVSYTATGGTITVGGLYTAGSLPGLYRVVVRHSAGTRADTATLTVSVPPPVLTQLILSPSTVTLPPSGTQQFSVAGIWSDVSTSPPEVAYSSTGGTISPSGMYSAGSSFGTFRVIATHVNGTKADTSAITIAAPPTLRTYADGRRFSMGAAVNMDALRADARYQQVLATEYNSVVAEYVMNFSHIHPEASRYYFDDADQLLSFAQAHGMTVRGAPLVWHQLIPDWITGAGFTKPQLLAVLKEHISTIVARYRGKIISWDIVNEAIADDGLSLRNSWWMSTIGPEYIDSSFVWANRADPAAKLFLNDFGADAGGAKANAIFALVQALKARGVPIHGVAFQAHFPTASASTSGIKANLARFANAGFDVRVSEMDVQLPNSAGAAVLADQAALYRDVLDACLQISRCTGFTTWGFTDRYSWINAYFPGFGRALPFDLNYQPKSAHAALLARLATP